MYFTCIDIDGNNGCCVRRYGSQQNKQWILIFWYLNLDGGIVSMLAHKSGDSEFKVTVQRKVFFKNNNIGTYLGVVFIHVFINNTLINKIKWGQNYTVSTCSLPA